MRQAGADERLIVRSRGMPEATIARNLDRLAQYQADLRRKGKPAARGGPWLNRALRFSWAEKRAAAAEDRAALARVPARVAERKREHAAELEAERRARDEAIERDRREAVQARAAELRRRLEAITSASGGAAAPMSAEERAARMRALGLVGGLAVGLVKSGDGVRAGAAA